MALFGNSRERIPAKVGSPAKIDCEYTRSGTANVICGVQPKACPYFNKVTESRDGLVFASFLCDLAVHYEKAKKIILAMDNLSTHSKKSVIDLFGNTDGERLWSRFEIHDRPIQASWLNQAEIAIGMYTRQCLGDRRVGSSTNLGRITT